jgi:hypothetical protein
MNVSNPIQIAISFYDGPTEGFVRGVESGFTHYFKAVAWDEGQDRRLYLLGRLEERVFDQLLALVETSQTISNEVFAPVWKFSDTDREALANKLVEEGRRSLDSPAFLVLGANLLNDFEVVAPTEPQLQRAISLAQLQSPGSLADWLALST